MLSLEQTLNIIDYFTCQGRHSEINYAFFGIINDDRYNFWKSMV